VYGNSLSMYMGKNHGRTAFHNMVQRLLASLVRSVGFAIKEVPTKLFIGAINPESRERYQRTLDDRERNVFRGGLVPDLFAPQHNQMYDVKTTGFKSEICTSRRSAVDLKAATVPGEYRERAREVDRDYNGTPLGTVGPVEALLGSMPQVECFSVGAFGEVNKAVGTFLALLAEKGSNNPERFGCCLGKDQAKGIVAQFLGRRLGRSILKGVVKMRHTALAAIGGSVRPEKPKFSEAPENLGGEWDAMGRTWVPFF